MILYPTLTITAWLGTARPTMATARTIIHDMAIFLGLWRTLMTGSMVLEDKLHWRTAFIALRYETPGQPIQPRFSPAPWALFWPSIFIFWLKIGLSGAKAFLQSSAAKYSFLALNFEPSGSPLRFCWWRKFPPGPEKISNVALNKRERRFRISTTADSGRLAPSQIRSPFIEQHSRRPEKSALIV